MDTPDVQIDGADDDDIRGCSFFFIGFSPRFCGGLVLLRPVPAMPGTPKSGPLHPVPGSWAMNSMIARRVGSLSADMAKRLRSFSGGVMRGFAKRLAVVVVLSTGDPSKTKDVHI